MLLRRLLTTSVCSFLVYLTIAFAPSASAAEIRVLNANALTIALRVLALEHTKRTGTEVTFISGSPDRFSRRWTRAKNSMF